MTKDGIYLGLIILMVFVFVFRECSRPEKIDYADQAFKDTIEVLRQEKSIIQSRQDKAVKVYKDKLVSDSINLRAQESKIQALERKAVQQRTPRVETLIVDNPELLAFVTTQQEIIAELKVEIDTLKSQAQFQRKLNEDLIVAEFMEDKIEAAMQIQSAQRIDQLERSAKKKERKSKLKGVLVSVALIGGLLFGASL